eukprot:12044750-Alexandrium_andersonii.AAC.1
MYTRPSGRIVLPKTESCIIVGVCADCAGLCTSWCVKAFSASGWERLHAFACAYAFILLDGPGQYCIFVHNQ